MAVTHTTNLNLSKPDDDEYGDVSVINGNMDIIDTAVGGKAEKGDAIKDLSVNGTTITATKANNSTFTITTQDTTYANATTSAAGLMSAADKTKLNGVATNANNYSLPLAANGTRGGVQLGYSTSGKNYAVQQSSEKLYVNVPWTDTTYGVATTGANGLMSASDKSKLNGIANNANNYSLPLAASGTRGGVQLGYSTNGRNYAVAAASEKLYVNVPWTDHYAWSDITGKPANYPGGCTGTAGGVAWANVSGKPTILSTYLWNGTMSSSSTVDLSSIIGSGRTIWAATLACIDAYDYVWRQYTCYVDGTTIYVRRYDGGYPGASKAKIYVLYT